MSFTINILGTEFRSFDDSVRIECSWYCIVSVVAVPELYVLEHFKVET